MADDPGNADGVRTIADKYRAPKTPLSSAGAVKVSLKLPWYRGMHQGPPLSVCRLLSDLLLYF